MVSDIGKTDGYLQVRNVRIIPPPPGGGDVFIHAGSKFGYDIVLFTGTHDPHPVRFHKTGGNTRPIRIDADAWICSHVRLFNCHIGRGAIVAFGSVVRSRDVPPWTMVEGNPAQIVARFSEERDKWIYLDEPEPLSTRRYIESEA